MSILLLVTIESGSVILFAILPSVSGIIELGECIVPTPGAVQSLDWAVELLDVRVVGANEERVTAHV